MNMLFGMFDDIKKNNFGKVEIRIYFREISIIEFYNDRFEKSLKKIDNLISRFNKKINRYNITRDIDKVLMVYTYIFNNIYVIVNIIDYLKSKKRWDLKA